MLSKEIALANLKTFRVELTDAMRGNKYREGVLIKGEFGWAEFAPFPNHSIEHSTRWLQAALEMAWTKLPDPPTNLIEVNAISTSNESKKAIEILNATGCKTLKVKLEGKDLIKDINFLEQIVAFHKNVIFRIDFNGSLKIDDVIKYCTNLSNFNVEYVEQPCATIEELIELKDKTTIEIAVDENLRLAPDSTNTELINSLTQVADFIVVKPIPIGGIERFTEISEKILNSGKKVVVSGSMDTSIGLYMTLLAQSLISDRSGLVAGAATGSILSTDVVTKTLKPHNGFVEVKRLDIDESIIKESSNHSQLIQRINMAFDFGRERNWF